MLKSIVAVAAGLPEDEELLGVASALAARSQGRVRVIPAFPDPAADLIYYGATLGTSLPEVAVERVTAAEREKQDKIEALARAVASARKADVSVARRDLLPAIAVANAAVLADLTAFHGAAARGALNGVFAETLIATRAPCLVVNGAAEGFATAAIAWDGSAQAGRAVRAALPLLRLASGVLVLRNTEDAGLDEGGVSSETLAEYLGRHGVKGVIARDIRGARVAPSLLDAARAEKCDLLVSGAYGRPRLYEMVLGGTTRSLVQAEQAPHLLLAH
ncbi:universal stress protein [Vitreimonas sp.]|uniref:universal stress protein n=1 Tax=Vitreimonas sp. TaxID=3069702 RepID=UPI002ED9B318